MSRRFVILFFLVVAGAAVAALSMNGDEHFDSYSNPDGRGVCYGHDFSGVSLALEDTVVVLNGFRVCPLVPRQVEPPEASEQEKEEVKRIRKFAQELRVRRREMIANKAPVADIRAEMIVRLNQSDLVVPGSVQHRDYYSDIGEDHIWVQYKGEDHRTLLVFGYLESEQPSREEILESDRMSARNVFEGLKNAFDHDRFVVIWSGGTKSFAPEIVDEVMDELSRIRSKQTAPTRAEWNNEKHFFSYGITEQIRVPLARATCQQY